MTTLRKRQFAEAPPSLTMSSLDDEDYDIDQDETDFDNFKRNYMVRNSSTASFFKRKFGSIFSPKTALPWGHKPHGIMGLSCLMFAIPAYLCYPCYPKTAASLAVVTVTSFCSDHLYTGLDSWFHVLDKICAPSCYFVCLHTVYSVAGLACALSSLLPMGCYMSGCIATRQNNYNKWLILHTLWHILGIGIMSTIFWWKQAYNNCTNH